MDLLAQLSALNVINDIAIPALAAGGGYWFAGRRFRREHLWKEKYQDYQQVISSLEAIRFWADETLSDIHMLPSVGWFDGKSPKDFLAQAKREIAKQAAIGTILLTTQAVARLEAFRGELFQLSHRLSEELHDDDPGADRLVGTFAQDVFMCSRWRTGTSPSSSASRARTWGLELT